MRCDIDAAMSGEPPLVSGDTCYVTTEGDVDLPVTTDVESPDAIKQLLRDLLAGRAAPAALTALASGRLTHDIYGELGRFPVPNRRATIAGLASRALALQARPLDGELHEPGATAAPAFRVAPASPGAQSPRIAAVAPTTMPSSRPSPLVPAPAWPPPPGTVVEVRDASPPSPMAITAELQRLRLKSMNAGAARRAPSRFTTGRYGRWIAAGGLTAGLLAVILWSAGVRAPRAPLPIELKGSSGLLPLWPFAATVLPVTPGLPSSDAAHSGASSPVLSRFGASPRYDDVVPAFEASSPLAPAAGAPEIPCLCRSPQPRYRPPCGNAQRWNHRHQPRPPRSTSALRRRDAEESGDGKSSRQATPTWRRRRCVVSNCRRPCWNRERPCPQAGHSCCWSSTRPEPSKACVSPHGRRGQGSPSIATVCW